MTIESDHRLEDLISKATQTISAAVTAIEHANRELVQLLEIRSTRPWNADEFARYLDLSQREHAAHRQYVAGRRWFDNARRQRSDRNPQPDHR
jgi:hypothetical protein